MLGLTLLWTTITLESSSPSRSASDTETPLTSALVNNISVICQDSSSFYLVMSARDDDHNIQNCQGPCHQGNWQLKRVSSRTGPYTGTVLSDAIRRPHSVEGETVLLWRADSRVAGGWKEGHSYRFSLTHRPRLGLIKLRLWEGETLVADSGNVIDDGQHSLRGGRLGVYCDSQEQIIWSALSYR